MKERSKIIVVDTLIPDFDTNQKLNPTARKILTSLWQKHLNNEQTSFSMKELLAIIKKMSTNTVSYNLHKLRLMNLVNFMDDSGRTLTLNTDLSIPIVGGISLEKAVEEIKSEMINKNKSK